MAEGGSVRNGAELVFSQNSMLSEIFIVVCLNCISLTLLLRVKRFY